MTRETKFKATGSTDSDVSSVQGCYCTLQNGVKYSNTYVTEWYSNTYSEGCHIFQANAGGMLSEAAEENISKREILLKTRGS